MRHIKHSLLAGALLAVAGVVVKVDDWAADRNPPPQRVPVGAKLVEGKPVKVKKDKPVPLDFAVLKKWTYVEGKTPIPAFIRAFDGQTVKMTGYMMPLREIDEITSFVLVPSLFGCCYGQPPGVNHVVLVKMASGTTSKFFGGAINVRGTFHCGEEKQGNYLISLYRLDADQVMAQ